jgi:repressor LexA
MEVIMSKGKISSKQEQILNYIKENILDKGYPPTVRDICAAVGLSSTSSVHAHLNTLEERGYIRRDPTKPRAIEILDDEGFNLSRREIVNVPIIGTVAAGQPILAEENITDYFPVPPEYLTNNQTFMLKVKGNSMINAGILYGDTIIVEQTNTAKNGDIVVALIEDSATVKTYYKENGHYRLQPENDTMEPIIVDDLMIIGKVIGLFRSYKY